METSRTKLRREVREKRLAYFENQSSSPYQPKLQEEPVYQAKSPSKNPYKDKTKIGRAKQDRSTHHYRQQIAHDGGREDRLTASGLSATCRSGRPSSARSGVPRHGLQYPPGPSGDDYANVTPLKRKNNRPSSAVPSAHGDQYRLDIADSARLTGSKLRPSSAKSGARPKRPQKDPTTDHTVQRPSTASAYRSDHENARRQSEFADFRKEAHVSSHYAKKETSGSKSRLSDRELQDFFRLREIRQKSGNDLSPSSSEGGLDAGGPRTYNFFRNQEKSHQVVPESRPYRDDPYGSRSKASLENGISRRVQSQFGSKVESKALQASEFHSAYSAENMLQSLLGSRKVKAKLHDELLSSFLENEGYESILTRKRNSSRPRNEVQNQGGPDLNGNEVDMDTALLKFHHTKSEELDNEHEESTDETEREKALSPIPSASDDVSTYWATQQEKQENVRVESVPSDGRLDGDDPVAGNKDEGEESGVEMDDLNFDVGALCNAAKQGDDILRQYIQGLTEKVKAKKGKESNPGETVLGEGSTKSSGKIDSLFAPKMPERKFEEKTIVASVHEKVTVPPAEQSYSALYSESDYMRKKEVEPIFVEDKVNLQNASTDGLVEMDHDHHSDNSMPSTNQAPYRNQFGSAHDSVGYRDTEPSVSFEARNDYQKDSVSPEDKETEFDQRAFNVQESFQDDDASVVSKVREPAVTADLLEKLGLFDTNDTSFTNPLSGQLEGSSVLLSHDVNSSTNDAGFKLVNGTLDDSDLGLESFRPDSRIVLPLEEVRDYTYSKVGVLTTSHVDSADLIEEVLDMPTASRPARAEAEPLRRTYDMSEEPTKGDIADPNVNTPFHSQIQRSKYGVSFVFDPQDTGNDLSGANAYTAFIPQPNQGPGNSKHGIAFEVDLTSARKQPKPPPSSKPSNTRLMTPSRGSPKLSRSSPQKSRPRKSPRTPDAHRYEVRNYHEKDRRMRKLSSPRAIASPVSNLASESSSTGDNQSSLRLSLPSNMDTDRPGAEGIVHLGDSLGDSLLDVEVGAPFLHSPRREAPLEDVNEVLDRISNFNPPAASRSVAFESQDTVGDIIGQNGLNFMVHQDERDPQGQRQDILKASKPRPSSANPKKTATKKPGSNRPTSAHSKMYSSPDKSYDRKWPQSSMAWMTQHKLTSSLIGGDQSPSDLSASGSKVKISQSRVNREFAGKSKPPVAVQMSRRDGEFVRVRSSKLFDGTVSRVLDGRGSVGVPPLTLQLIQDSPRGSESLSIWQLLPDEILLHIFSYLPQHKLVMCALTCQRFHRIAMDDSLWRTIRLENRDLTDFYLTYIGEKHPVSLTLHKCRGNLVTENGLRNLFRSCADSLQELNVTGCSKGELQGDSILLHVSRCFSLISLDTSWCAVTDNGLSAILDGCPRLETICLNGCQSVSDQCLRQIVNKYGSNLEVLELCGCFNLSPQTLTHLADTSNHLRTLNIAQCYKITDECVASVAPKFQSLQHWHLKGVKELRDSAVKKIARHCKKLRTLSIASCPHVTDVSLIEIATYLNSIRSLDASGCRKIGNEGMRCLATCCPYLEKVGLSSTSVTHKSVSSLASYASQTLMELKLNCCREITEASIIRLLKHCKKLKTLHLYGVKGLRNLGILKVQYPCIEYLEKVRAP